MSKQQSRFSHHARRDGNVVIVALRGRLDSFFGRGLKPEIDELLKNGAMCVVFDCQELSYIGAFSKDHNWLEEWTVVGAEYDYDLRNTEDGPWRAPPATRSREARQVAAPTRIDPDRR